MSNRVFTLLLILITCAITGAQGGSSTVGATYNKKNRQVTLNNGRIQLQIETKRGLNPNALKDLKNGLVYADANYIWPEGKTPELIGKPVISEDKDGGKSVTITAKSGSLEITQIFRISGKVDDSVDETISIKNTGTTVLEIPNFACGFCKTVSKSDYNALFTAIPFRVKPGRGELHEYSLNDLLTKKDNWTYAQNGWEPITVDYWPSEAWVWSQKGTALLISKYNPHDLEWSLLWPNKQPTGTETLGFGGAGIAKAGDPQGAASLRPGATFTFGTTRYQLLDGDWKNGYYAYRSLMTAKGHGTPSGFNPPVHWNELYDNKLWWEGAFYSPEARAELYKKTDMIMAAERGKEFGCEALYLDPGWDTLFGSMIWGEDRLGPMSEFRKMVSDTYGLKLALHTPLAPWTDATGYPVEARLMDKDGNRRDELCAASSAYQKAIIARFLELGKNGAYFLMFDGSAWPGECWDPSHGHSLPLKHKEHIDSIVNIAQQVHKVYPDILIEQHDPMTGPTEYRYCPMYFMHDRVGAFNEHWADEHMWDPMRDLMERRSMSQYYFSLAYGLPSYLHIDLRSDNKECLVFWWNASTCRHLGVGGKSDNPEIWEAQKSAMKEYLKYKAFFTQGTFYGLDETVHVHTLPEAKKAVINLFNLTDEEQEKVVKLKLSDIGLPAGEIDIINGVCTGSGEQIELRVKVPAKGHRLMVLQMKDKNKSSGSTSEQLAKAWLVKQKNSVTPQEYELLARGQATLLGNIGDPKNKALETGEAPSPEDANRPLPWHPLRGIYPSPYVYRGVWSWDGPLHAIALARWDSKLAREQLEIIMKYQQEGGLFPDVVFESGDVVKDFGKPPVMPWACAVIDRFAPDKDFLAKSYPKFVLYEKHLMANRGGQQDGLFHYGGGIPNFEAGWDNSVRWDNGCENLWTVDMNCYMVLLYESMAYIAERLDIPSDKSMWLKKAADLKQKLNDTLWNEAAGAYMDRDRNTKEFSGVLSPASFMPLYVKAVSKDRAERLAKLAADPKKFFPGMPSVSYDNPNYTTTQFWRGPTWLNVSYFAVKGLKDYGYDSVAGSMRKTILDWCSQNKDHLYEYYDSKSGKGLGAKQYGWTGSFVIEFIMNWK